MYKHVSIAAILLLALFSFGVAAESAPVPTGVLGDKVPTTVKTPGASPLTPIERKKPVRAGTKNVQTGAGDSQAGTGNAQTGTETPPGTPQGTVSISVVGADIRNNGYTIEVRNDSSIASGYLTVQVFKSTSDGTTSGGAGGVVVQTLGAGANTQITIDQVPGWNTGYDVLTVDVIEQVEGHGVVVGRRHFGIPPL